MQNALSVPLMALSLKELFCALRPQSDYPLDDQIGSWRHIILTGHKVFAAGDAEKTVGSFTVPANCNWVVYSVGVVSMTVPGGFGGAAQPGVNITQEAINQENSTSPDSTMLFEDGNNAALTPRVNYLALAGQHFLYVFPENQLVNLTIDPQLAVGDTSHSIFSVIHGFLVPPQVGSVLASIETNWISQANAY